MTQFGGMFIPSLQATFSVAWETIKSKLPEESPCMEQLRTVLSRMNRPRQETAEMQEMGGHPMPERQASTSGYEDPNAVNVAEESFSYQRSE